MTFTFSAISTLFLLIKVIKNLSKVLLQQYNYPELIWIKQTVSFACSNYRSNWQLIDNFCLHLSEPNRIETRRKRIVNRIVTTEPRCTVISVNRFTSIKYIHSVFQSSSLIWCDILPRLFWQNNKTDDSKTLNLKCKRINRAAHQYVTEFVLGRVISPHILWYMMELFSDDGVHLSDFGNLTYVQTFKNLIHTFIEESDH